MASFFNKQAALDAPSDLNDRVTLRETVASLPDKPVAMPYEMRSELTWIDFGNRTNPLGAPKNFVQAIHTALVDGEHTYVPDSDATAFRHAVATYLKLSSDNILFGTSPTQLITYAACAFDYVTVGIPIPCPMSYEIAVGNAGHSILPLSNPVSFAPPSLANAQAQGDFKGIVLGNPTYPSSRLLPQNVLLHYLEYCDWVIVDESNIELSFGAESMVDLVEQYPNLIVIRNASTTFGMPGIPMSYLVAHEQMVEHIEQFYTGGEIGMFGEVLARLIMNQKSYLDQTHDFLDTEIPWMQCMLRLVPGVNIFPAEGNFVLCEYAPGPDMQLGVRSSSELVSSLQLAGFHVDDLDDAFGLPHSGFFCVAVRTREENERLLAAMREIIKGVYD